MFSREDLSYMAAEMLEVLKGVGSCADIADLTGRKIRVVEENDQVLDRIVFGFDSAFRESLFSLSYVYYGGTDITVPWSLNLFPNQNRSQVIAQSLFGSELYSLGYDSLGHFDGASYQFKMIPSVRIEDVRREMEIARDWAMDFAE